MKKIFLILCFLSAFVNAQITQLDQWKTKGNTFTTNANYLGTNNSRSIFFKTNSTLRFKIDSIGVVKAYGRVILSNTVNTIGNMTLNSNSTATTTMPASSGTVANLSDVVYSVHFEHGATNPSDGVTYYFGNSSYLFSTAAANGTITIPYNSKLVGWNYNVVVGGTIGSAESVTLQIAGTTTLNLSSSITYSAASAYQGFSATGLSSSFPAGSNINGKLLMPSFGTNPTAVYGGLTLWFIRE